MCVRAYKLRRRYIIAFSTRKAMAASCRIMRNDTHTHKHFTHESRSEVSIMWKWRNLLHATLTLRTVTLFSPFFRFGRALVVLCVPMNRARISMRRFTNYVHQWRQRWYSLFGECDEYPDRNLITNLLKELIDTKWRTISNWIYGKHVPNADK